MFWASQGGWHILIRVHSSIYCAPPKSQGPVTTEIYTTVYKSQKNDFPTVSDNYKQCLKQFQEQWGTVSLTLFNERWPLRSTLWMMASGSGQAAFAAFGSRGAKASLPYLLWNCFCGLGRSLPGKTTYLGWGWLFTLFANYLLLIK